MGVIRDKFDEYKDNNWGADKFSSFFEVIAYIKGGLDGWQKHMWEIRSKTAEAISSLEAAIASSSEAVINKLDKGEGLEAKNARELETSIKNKEPSFDKNSGFNKEKSDNEEDNDTGIIATTKLTNKIWLKAKEAFDKANTNTTNISTNTTAISNNGDTISSNATAISNNAKAIQENKDAIENNTGSGDINYACIVNATGTGAPNEIVDSNLPAEIIKNTRYVLTNPFGINTPVIVVGEIFSNDKWAPAGSYTVNTSSNYARGTSFCYVQGEGIIVQTLLSSVGTNSNLSGGGHASTGAINTAPCRVHVWRVKV